MTYHKTYTLMDLHSSSSWKATGEVFLFSEGEGKLIYVQLCVSTTSSTGSLNNIQEISILLFQQPTHKDKERENGRKYS